jgi:ribonuclease P/MRP protein subunit RPP40
LIIPQELLELVQEKLLKSTPGPAFKRVVLSLHEILSGDFFTEYIKKGNDWVSVEERWKC